MVGPLCKRWWTIAPMVHQEFRGEEQSPRVCLSDGTGAGSVHLSECTLSLAAAHRRDMLFSAIGSGVEMACDDQDRLKSFWTGT